MVKQLGGADEVRIDIWKENSYADPTQKHIHQLKNSNKLSKRCSLAIGAAIANAVVNFTTTTSSSSSSWAVEVAAVVLGLSLSLAGRLTLRASKQYLSPIIISIAAMATASSIIISLASHLPPLIAWTVAPLAFLLAAAALAFAFAAT